MTGGRIIARETILALRKDVTAKCYGGDITRKLQAEGRQQEDTPVQPGRLPQEEFINSPRMDG